MQLKKQITRFLMVGGLAVMMTGVSQAGGCAGCCWCGSPAPKAISQQTALSQPAASHPSAFLAFFRTMFAFL